ncbi:uncharacterized protein LOC143240943 isoform X2 [Tachypleus tridentatus]
MYYQSFVSSAHPYESRPVTSLDVSMVTTGREREIPLDLSVKQPSRPENFMLFEQQKLAALRASGLSHTVASRSVIDPSIFHLDPKPYGEGYTTNSSVNIMPTATSLCSRKHSVPPTQERPQPASPGRYSTAGKVQFRENGEPCSAALAPPYIDPHTPTSVQRLIPTDTQLGTSSLYRQAPNRFMNVLSPAVYEKREDFSATTTGRDTLSVSNSSLDESQFRWRMKCSATSDTSSVLRTNQTSTSSSLSRAQDSWISWTKERNCASVENHPVGLTMKSYYSSLGGLARLEEDMDSRSSQLYQPSLRETYREQLYSGTYDKNNESLSTRKNVPPDLNSTFRSKSSKNITNEVIVIDDDPQPPRVSIQENRVKYESGDVPSHVTNSGHHLLPTKRPYSIEDNEASVPATKMPRLVPFHGNKSYESDSQTNLVLYPDPPTLTAAVVTIATTTQTGMFNATTHSSSSKVAAVHQAKKEGVENCLSRDSNCFSLSKTVMYEAKEQGEPTFNLNNISQKQPYQNINVTTTFKSLTSDIVHNTRRESKSFQEVLEDRNASTPSVVERNLLANNISHVNSVDQKFYSISNQPSGSEVKGTSLGKKSHQVSYTEVDGISPLSNVTTPTPQQRATEIGICYQTNSLTQQNPCYKGHEVSFSSSVSSSITQTEVSSKIPVYSCSPQVPCKTNNLKDGSVFNNSHRQISHTNLSNVPNKVLSPHNKPYTDKKEMYPKNAYSHQVFCSDSKDKSLFNPVSHQVLHPINPIHHKVTANETKSEPLLSLDQHQVYCNKAKLEFHEAHHMKTNNRSLLNPLPQVDKSLESMIRTDYHMISQTEENNGPLLNPVSHQMLHTDTNGGFINRAHHQVPCCEESNALSTSTHRQIVHTSANSWPFLQPTYCNVSRAETSRLHEQNVALHRVTRIEANSVPVFSSSSQALHVETTNIPVFNSVSHQPPTCVTNRRPFFNNKNIQTQNVERSGKQSFGNTSYPVLYKDDSEILHMKNTSHQASITDTSRAPFSNVSSYRIQRNDTNMTPLANNIPHRDPSTEARRRPLSNISSHHIQRNEANITPLANNVSHRVSNTETPRTHVANASSHQIQHNAINMTPLVNTSHQVPCTETTRTPLSNVSSHQMQHNERIMTPLANNMSHQVQCTKNIRTLLPNVSSHQIQHNETNMTPLTNMSHQVQLAKINRTSLSITSSQEMQRNVSDTTPESKHTFYQVPDTDPARTVLQNSTSLQIQRNEARVSPMANTNYHDVQHTEAHRTDSFNTPYKFAFTQANRQPMLDNTVHQDTRIDTNKSTLLNNVSYQGHCVWASESRQLTCNEINTTVLSRSSNHDLSDQTNKKFLLNKKNGQIAGTESSRNIKITNSFCKIPNKEDKSVSLLNHVVHQNFLHPQSSCAPVLNNGYFNKPSPNGNTNTPSSRYRDLNSRSENVPVWKSIENQTNDMKNKVYGKFMYHNTSNDFVSTFSKDNKLQGSQASCTVASGDTQSTITTSHPSSGLKKAALETSKMGVALSDTLTASTVTTSIPVIFTTANGSADGNQNYTVAKDLAKASIESSEDRTNEDVSTAETDNLSLTVQGQLKTDGSYQNDNLETIKANSSSVSNNYTVDNTNAKTLLNSTVLHKLLSSSPSQSHLPDNSLPVSISHINCKRGPNIGQSPLKIKNSKGSDRIKWRREICRKRPMMQDSTKEGCQDRRVPKRKTELVKKQNQSVQPSAKPKFQHQSVQPIVKSKQERKTVQPTVKLKSQHQSVKHSVKSKEEHQPVQSTIRPKQDIRRVTRKKEEFSGLTNVDSLTKNKHVNTRAQHHRNQFVDFQPRVLGARTRTQTGRNGNLTFRNHRNSNKSVNTRKRDNKVLHGAKTDRRLRNHLLARVYKEENSSEEETTAKKPLDENSKLGAKVTKESTHNFRRPSTWHSRQNKQTGRHVVRRKRLKSGLDMIPKPYKKKENKISKA